MLAPWLRMALSRRWTSETAAPGVAEGERETYRYAEISCNS